MKINLPILKLSLLALVTTICLSAYSQKKKVPFLNSTIVPGAEGTVKVKKDKNGNYHMEVDVENLANSKQLTPPKNTYVVWIETKESGIKNIGQVTSSGSLLSKTKKASITTVSPTKPTRIFFTAEDSPNVETPAELIVLTTATF